MRFTLFSIVCLPLLAFGQCPELPASGGALGYQDRGNRCEGLYRARVSSADLELVQFTMGALVFKGEEDEVIILSTPAKGIDGAVKVRARGIPNDLFYRMDAELAHPRATLEWRVRDVLARDSRTRYARNIGLYGYQDESADPVYVPIRASSTAMESIPLEDTLLIQLISSTRLSRVEWKIRNQTEYQLLNDGRSYRAGRPILIRLPKNLKALEYTIEIRAKVYNEPDTLQRRFDFRL